MGVIYDDNDNATIYARSFKFNGKWNSKIIMSQDVQGRRSNYLRILRLLMREVFRSNDNDRGEMHDVWYLKAPSFAFRPVQTPVAQSRFEDF